MRPICFYHRADLDGVCSAAIVKHFVPDVELVGIDYQDEFPWLSVMTPATLNLETGETIAPEKRTVYLVDVSLPIEDMKRLHDISNLVFLDHHKTALDAMREAGILTYKGICTTDRAACEIVWNYFSHGAEPPEVVRLLGRYDVWDRDNLEWSSRILPFHYGCRAIEGIYDPTNAFWSYSFASAPDKDGTVWFNYATPSVPFDMAWFNIVGSGAAILRYQAEANRRACEAGAHEFLLPVVTEIRPSGWYTEQERLEKFVDEPGTFLYDRFSRQFGWLRDFSAADGAMGYLELTDADGDISDKYVSIELSSTDRATQYRVLACNTIVFNSQFFEGFYDPEKHDVMCAYCQLKDGRWKVSLYSTKPEIDCGGIAKTFGGGGHKGAAGFICDRLPWETL